MFVAHADDLIFSGGRQFAVRDEFETSGLTKGSFNRSIARPVIRVGGA
jgi:hypothetical protein